MEDSSQLLSGGKLLKDGERESAERFSSSHDGTSEESLDQRACSPDHPINRKPDSNECRECLAALSHRLAQPMTALRGGLELGLLGKRTVADYRSLLDQSLQLADNLAQLIIALRDIGESGAPGGPAHSVDVEKLATEALAEMEGLAQSRDLRLQLHSTGAVRVCANPERLCEGLQSLLAWVIQNSAGGGVIAVELSATEGEAHIRLSPPRLDLQYLQIKILQDVTNPGLLFAHAARNGALGWAINQRFLEGLGGELEILAEGSSAGCIWARFPLAPGD